MRHKNYYIIILLLISYFVPSIIEASTISFDFSGQLRRVVDTNGNLGSQVGDSFSVTITFENSLQDLDIYPSDPQSGRFPNSLVSIDMNVEGVPINFSFKNAVGFTNVINDSVITPGGAVGDFLTFNYQEFTLDPLDAQTATFILNDFSGSAVSSDLLADVDPTLFTSGGEFLISIFDFDSTNIIIEGDIGTSNSVPVPEPSTYLVFFAGLCLWVCTKKKYFIT